MISTRAGALGAVIAAIMIGSGLRAEVGQNCREDAMIVFDASGSMSLADAEGRPRIDVARESLAAVLPEATHLRRTGLIVYGPGGSCFVDLKLRPTLNSAEAIQDIIEDVSASAQRR